MDQAAGPARPKQTIVLCFDGTGNKFTGDDTDSNILKIYRMLDKSEGDTFTFYQPGIGTYVTTTHIGTTSGAFAKVKSWYLKAKDSAIGSSFAEHVMGGYRFLMRYYNAGDDLYFFGFSRGAYTARFLAEMLDHVGLLSAGNEELTRFAWKTYAKWASRQSNDTPEGKKKEGEMYDFMRGFRETFSRRVRRIRFLGLFDTVNSVPAFENAWMQRSKFPYTARSSAKVIRHAVSIDERRAKFRQDLITGSKRSDRNKYGQRYDTIDFETMAQAQHWDAKRTEARNLSLTNVFDEQSRPSLEPSINITENDELSHRPAPNHGHSVDHFADAPEHQSSLQLGSTSLPQTIPKGPSVTLATGNLRVPINTNQRTPLSPGLKFRRWSDTSKSQDIQEVWFPGCHGDIGGGWAKGKDEGRMLAHVALVWMVKEAERAGLRFDPIKMAALNCCPDAIDDNGERCDAPEAFDYYHSQFHSAATDGKIHDSLIFGGGLPNISVSAWKFMEYLPFRRMDLQDDGSWKAIRWPLPMGETRDIPTDAQVHISALHRMNYDPKYRPGNLIVGGGGRGMRTAPVEYGTGEWVVFKNEGDKILETYVRAHPPKVE